jgi:hypothetical protein
MSIATYLEAQIKQCEKKFTKKENRNSKHT